MRSNAFFVVLATVLAVVDAAPLSPPVDPVKVAQEQAVDRLPVGRRGLIGFGGPLSKPSVSTEADGHADLSKLSGAAHAEGTSPIGDFCADASLNEADQARCRGSHDQPPSLPTHKDEPVAHAPAPAPHHDEPRPQPSHNNEPHHQYTPQPPKAPAPAAPKAPAKSECKPNPALLHAELNLLPLLSACVDILGNSCAYDHDQKPAPKPVNKPAPKPVYKSPCGYGYRYSPVLQFCVALLPNAPRPVDGHCPAHYAHDWQLDVCVVLAVDAPKPKDNKCSSGWGYDTVLGACVSLDIEHNLGKHYDINGGLLPAGNKVILAGTLEGHLTAGNTAAAPAHDSQDSKCPAGHFKDAIVGCIAADAHAILA